MQVSFVSAIYYGAAHLGHTGMIVIMQVALTESVSLVLECHAVVLRMLAHLNRGVPT